MENPAIKILTSLFSKRKFNNFKRNFNKKTIIASTTAIFSLIIIFYFSKPYFINYNSEKNIIENKIKNSFKINTKINGDISYKLFPSPRIEIQKVNFNFNKSKKGIYLEKVYIKVSPFGIINSKDLKLNKMLILNQTMEIQPDEFKNYFRYFTLIKYNNIISKNSKIFFLDERKNRVLFEKVDFSEKFDKTLHELKFKGIFSNKKLKFNFVDKINGEKKLKFQIPNLGVSLNAIFDSPSTLQNITGKSQIKLFDSILTVNFKAKEKFEIYDSFFRNKFFNSKVDGYITFKENFFFDLNLDVNQINLRKLLLYYFTPGKSYNFLSSGISKKINGKFNIQIKNTNSFIGRIKNIKMFLVFENGDMKIENGSAILPHDSKVNFKILHSGTQKETFLDFSLNFYSNNGDKFFRKFNIYDFEEKKVSLALDGRIDLITNQLRIKNVVVDGREKLSRGDTLSLERNFNEFVLDDGVLGILDFFKIKKFSKEISN